MRANGAPRSSATPGVRFAILAYHRVAPTTTPPTLPGHVEAGIVTSPQEFDAHIREVSRHANVLSLGAALALSESGQLPRRAVVLTFDDGFREHFGAVHEKLCEFGLTATLFVTGHSLDAGLGLRWLEWFYMLEALASQRPAKERFGVDLTMKRSLRGMGYAARTELLGAVSMDLGLSASMQAAAHAQLFADRETVLSSFPSECLTVGGHTLTHPCLRALNVWEKRREIVGSRRQLASVAASSLPPFAYPFGGFDAYDDECVKIVQDVGFFCACTSVPGYNTAETPRFELRRFDMCEHSLERVLGGLSEP